MVDRVIKLPHGTIQVAYCEAERAIQGFETARKMDMYASADGEIIVSDEVSINKNYRADIDRLIIKEGITKG